MEVPWRTAKDSFHPPCWVCISRGAHQPSAMKFYLSSQLDSSLSTPYRQGNVNERQTIFHQINSWILLESGEQGRALLRLSPYHSPTTTSSSVAGFKFCVAGGVMITGPGGVLSRDKDPSGLWCLQGHGFCFPGPGIKSQIPYLLGIWS